MKCIMQNKNRIKCVFRNTGKNSMFHVKNSILTHTKQSEASVCDYDMLVKKNDFAYGRVNNVKCTQVMFRILMYAWMCPKHDVQTILHVVHTCCTKIEVKPSHSEICKALFCNLCI